MSDDLVDEIERLRGAIETLVADEVISTGRARELHGMTIEQQRVQELIDSYTLIPETVFPGGRSNPLAMAFGGTVPGALGSPQPILAHGGERITPPSTSTYFSNVRQGDQISINAPVSFSNNVDSDAVAHRVSQRASRELGRIIAARRAFGG